MPVLVREMQASDIDAVRAIIEAGVPGVSTATPAHLAAITLESSIALVTEHDGVVVGFCLVLAPGAGYKSVNYGWFSSRYDDFVYLDRVAVAPEHQGQGIGSVEAARRPPHDPCMLQYLR